MSECINKYIWLVIPLIGLFYVFLTPPLQAPDESEHFKRAFGISEGYFVTIKSGDNPGSPLPTIVETIYASLGGLPFHPEHKTSFHELHARYLASPEMTQENLAQKSFSTYYVGVYSPVPYLSQACGILIGKLFHVRVLGALYLARIMNLLVSCLIIALALKLLKFERNYFLLFFVIIMMPMLVFQMSSCSPDSFTNAIAFLNIALVLSLYSQWNRKLFSIFLFISALLALSKNIYLLIPFSILPAIWFQDIKLKDKFSQLLLLVAAILIPAGGWALVMNKDFATIGPGLIIDPKAQFIFFINNPWQVTQVFVATWWKYLEIYRQMFIGLLGWVDTEIAHTKTYLRIIFAAALLTSQSSQLFNYKTLVKRCCFLMIFLGSVYGISLAAYLALVPPHALILQGIQGRYFIPFAPLLFLAFSGIIKLKPNFYRVFYFGVMTYVIIYQIYALRILVQRYYG